MFQTTDQTTFSGLDSARIGAANGAVSLCDHQPLMTCRSWISVDSGHSAPYVGLCWFITFWLVVYLPF